MGQLVPVKPVLRIAAITSRDEDLLAWCRDELQLRWGDIKLHSAVFDFNQTQYYAAEMGPGLKKQLLAFAVLADPANLADWKLMSNEIEQRRIQSFSHPVGRPVNIDPGYLTEAKLVLASTKDRDHRIYLGQGIYAEVTLYFHHKAWRSSRWTYADFQQPEYHEYLTRCRNYLRTAMPASGR